MKQLLNGNLIIIGGAEDKEGRKEILRKVCDCINKEDDLLLIATVASEYPKEMETKYRKAFGDLGVKNIMALNIENRDEAFLKTNVELVEKAKLIFFTGGDQLRITSILGGTAIYNELKKSAEKGSYIVGTSAGASVMSNTMIVEGDSEEDPKKCMVEMSPGLGLVSNVIIDQHFMQRGRIGRLLTGVAQNPEVLGVGIDENTAIIVNKDGNIEVIGENSVYFIDGSEISYSNVSEQYMNENLSIFNVKIHVLKQGNKFSLISRTPFEEEESQDENN